MKCERPLGSFFFNYKSPRKRSTKNDTTKESHEYKIQDLINPEISEEISEPKTQVNEELSIISMGDEKSLDRSK